MDKTDEVKEKDRKTMAKAKFLMKKIQLDEGVQEPEEESEESRPTTQQHPNRAATLIKRLSMAVATGLFRQAQVTPMVQEPVQMEEPKVFPDLPVVKKHHRKRRTLSKRLESLSMPHPEPDVPPPDPRFIDRSGFGRMIRTTRHELDTVLQAPPKLDFVENQHRLIRPLKLKPIEHVRIGVVHSRPKIKSKARKPTIHYQCNPLNGSYTAWKTARRVPLDHVVLNRQLYLERKQLQEMERDELKRHYAIIPPLFPPKDESPSRIHRLIAIGAMIEGLNYVDTTL